MSKAKTNIVVNPQVCTGCSDCQLMCSFQYTGVFNPERARIVPEPPDRIVFTDECIANCSLCTKYCAQGAIKRISRPKKVSV